MFENDTYTYKGWMTSDYFLKRAFGALLYQAAAALIVYAVILAIIIALILFAAFFMGIAGLSS
jgi:subtilase family serine protease